jgi:hypothetical protein
LSIKSTPKYTSNNIWRELSICEKYEAELKIKNEEEPITKVDTTAVLPP